LPASWTEKSVASIVFFTLALGGLIPKLAGAALLLLGLISVASLSFRRAWRPPDLLPLERLLILSVVLFVAIWLAAWWWHGLDPWGQLGVGRIGRLLLIVPIFLLVRQIPAAEAAWWHGLSIGAILFGLYAWLSLANGVIGPFGERITGPVNPLYFGALALSFALMLLPRVSDPDLSAAARTLAIFAILMGMSASALSGSRGTWLASSGAMVAGKPVRTPVALPASTMRFIARPIRQTERPARTPASASVLTRATLLANVVATTMPRQPSTSSVMGWPTLLSERPS